MVRQIGFGLGWLTLVAYTVAFSALNIESPEKAFQQDLDLIIKMFTGEWNGINPTLIAIFLIMGIFPTLYGAFILFDSQKQKVSPTPFFIASFGLGAFALLPYFALRKPDIAWDKEKGWLLKILDSRLMAIAASISVVAVAIWGIVNGNWSDFVAEWHTSQFVHIMTVDFCILSILLPIAIIKDDMSRRGIENKQLYWLISLIPLVGSFVYWCIRPQLTTAKAIAVETDRKVKL